MTNLIYLLEGETEAAATGMGDWWTMPLLLVVFIGAMYFFMIRPQKKQEKQVADMRNNLMVGDEVTTSGGILGRVVHIKDDVVTLETGADRVKIKVRKWAIATVDKKIEEKTPAPKGGFKVTGVKKGKDAEKTDGENKPEKADDKDKPELK